MVAKEVALLLWTGCQGTQMNNCHENLNTSFTGLNGIKFNEILVARANFEKCTIAMLGGPCSQHVTGNTSRLNQPQSAIIMDPISQRVHSRGLYRIFHKTIGYGTISRTSFNTVLNVHAHPLQRGVNWWRQVMRLWTVFCEEFPQFEFSSNASCQRKIVCGLFEHYFHWGNQWLHITPGHLPSQPANQRRYTHVGCSSLFNYFTHCFQKFLRALRTVCSFFYTYSINIPDSNVHEANMGPAWVLSAPGGPHVGPMNLVVWDKTSWFLVLDTQATLTSSVSSADWFAGPDLHQVFCTPKFMN